MLLNQIARGAAGARSLTFAGESEAATEPLDARQLDLPVIVASSRRKPATGRPRGRLKLFGDGRPKPLDREAKVRVMTLARALMRRTEKGRAYGAITAKALAVLEALLWGFHNAKSGLCFPSYEKIADRARCARSTVAEALKMLEAAGLVTWVNRLVRVRERAVDLFGAAASRVRVIRTSNGYAFIDPKPAIASKSEKPTGTRNQVLILSSSNKLEARLAKLGALISASAMEESVAALSAANFNTPLMRRR